MPLNLGARDAKLIEKADLTVLCLEWSGNLDDSQDKTSELDTLNMLHPNKSLKELTIRHYGGTEFSTWLKGHSFPHMVLLRIENCKKCTSLPLVGQLPSLKHLFIKGMASVKNVGVEFYGDSCSQPFRLLETLCFEDMEEWENWSPNGEFPQLREISIENCPKLLGKLPNHLPLLKKVLVDECQRLVVSILSFPELCELQIEGSKGVVRKSKVDFSSLILSSLSTISEFTSPIEGLVLEGLTHVENLAIKNCEELSGFWSNDVGLLKPLPCLRVLRFYNCLKLVSLVAEEVKEQPLPCWPSILREIFIYNCNGMESLPKAINYNNTYLECIGIYNCDSLKHFVTGQLPPTLKRLEIWSCENILILLDEHDTNSCSRNISLLNYLSIMDCPSLKSLTSSGELPATLTSLSIRDCGELESMAKSFHHNSSLECFEISTCRNLKSLPMGIHALNHLNLLYVCECPSLVYFPDRGLLPGNLRKLWISDCEKMQTLPNYIHNVTSLQELQIWKCPGIVSFPEEGFPSNLTSLEIWDCNNTEALFEWGLHKLTSLKELEINSGCPHLVSFPGMMLPASLTNLTIRNFPNLKYLSSKGFQFLTSLETLSINDCENLTFFLEDGFPPSLQELYIKKCLMLKERFQKDQGREWFKIAHIPLVEIDDRFIYDPNEENQ